MENINATIKNLGETLGENGKWRPVPFEEFLLILAAKPAIVIRSVFQVFYDMIKFHVREGKDEYSDDPESIKFFNFDFSRLFIEAADNPFFADRLLANRLMNVVNAFKRGAQQNKIYIFRGPPGSGKSTFLNILLKKFEEYANMEAGKRYETVWRLDKKMLGGGLESETNTLLERLSRLLDGADVNPEEFPARMDLKDSNNHFIEVPCPSHDNPILMIPREYRRSFFDDLFKNDEFKWKLCTEKEYSWIFKESPCTICSSIYDALMDKLGKPLEIYKMLYARPYRFNRRLGEGISVFNPGDRTLKQNVMSNPILQKRLNLLFQDSNQTKYLYSQYAKTNSGIYGLMDIKGHNIERLIELHNIISDGVHKVEDIEENVNSLLLAVMNPEDKMIVQDFQSFSDRIEYVNIPYIMDLKTEVEIYRNVFGEQIEDSFLPRVLHNFARIIIASRLKTRSEALLEWIVQPEKYSLYCDENLQLLKMEIYSGNIPKWLTEEDRKGLTAKRRRRIISESENEGEQGCSGRDSINLFNEFYSKYSKGNKLINMSMLNDFFIKSHKELVELIAEGFMNSLIRMYDYTVLQEVKEALYYYNEEQISRDIQNYIFALNFETGTNEICSFTGDRLEITDEFFINIENYLLDSKIDVEMRLAFRKDSQKEYASRTLTQEIILDEKKITETTLYQSMYDRYVHKVKEKVLDPLLANENFRRGIKDYDTESFKTYDKKIKADVKFLINNLCTSFEYTAQGAKEICIYVIDNKIASKFPDS